MAPLCSVFRRFLRTKGLKYTVERADVLDAIIARDGLFEVEELLLSMRQVCPVIALEKEELGGARRRISEELGGARRRSSEELGEGSRMSSEELEELG
jgi:hypothetical protein